MNELPLSGYRVLELAHFIAGPVCGMYLADMGADVIKVESPPGATPRARSTAPSTAARAPCSSPSTATSAAWPSTSPGRRGGRAFLALAATADVVLEAHKGGVAERLGIDYPSVSAVNPRIVYCSLSAFGPTGPWREKPGSTCSCRPWVA